MSVWLWELFRLRCTVYLTPCWDVEVFFFACSRLLMCVLLSIEEDSVHDCAASIYLSYGCGSDPLLPEHLTVLFRFFNMKKGYLQTLARLPEVR